jgi:menaquinol-cytochrome c reductase iron-sulfur subunit
MNVPKAVKPTVAPTAGAANGKDIEPRRGFMAKVAAVVIGGLITMFPFLSGMLVVADPLRRSGGQGRKIRVASLDAIPDDGIPRSFPVISDRQDAWTHYASEPIGAVYLVRDPGATMVRAFNAMCPHAGCFVGYLPVKKYFQCPCHTSAFDLQGEILSDVSRVPPRGMDVLDCEITGDGGTQEVWVNFQEFQTGCKEKIVKA